jgi:hypothetical protein
VQIIGGDAELSMEVFDPATGIFNAKALLPPNADLLGATLSTQSRAALFTPSISQDPLLQSVLTPDQLALLDRADQSITEVPSQNQALVAGGINSAGQILKSANLVKSSSASVTTDKTDYAPGEIVTITGSGFQPNEQVQLSLHEFPEEYPDLMFSVITDQQGKFTVAEFAPQPIDIGRTFTLTAIGLSSGFTAQTAFTDGPRIGSVLVGSQSPNPVTSGNAATYTITIQRGTQAGSFMATLNITSTLPAGATASFSPSSVSFNACTGPNAGDPAHACNRQTVTLSISTVASTPAGSTPFTVRAFVTNPNQPTDFAEGNGTLAIAAACAVPSITTNPSDQTVTYGNNATFTAAVNGDPAPSVQWQLSTNNGASWSDISGAISTTLTVTAPSVAMSGNKYRAVFTNNCGGTATATSAAATLTVNKLTIVVTPTAGQKKTYGSADPTFAYNHAPMLIGSDTFSGALARDGGENVGLYNILLGTLALSSNYTLSFTSGVQFEIEKLTIVVTPTAGQKKTYGSADPTFAYNHAPVLIGSDTFSGALARDGGENVGLYNILLGTLALSSNYTLSFTSGVQFEIEKRPISVMAHAKSKVYGETDPALTYQITSGSLAFSDAFTGGLSRVAGENVGEYDIQQGTLSISNIGNYTLTYVGAKLTITKRPITVTADPKSKMYGQPDPEFTYQITSGSLAFNDAFTGTLSRVPEELVGTYPILQGDLTLNGNYILNYIGADLTITTAFAYSGFYPPIGGSVEYGNGGSYANPLKTFKLNSTIPVKFSATWLNGGAPLITGIHTLQAIKYSDASTVVGDPIDATPTDSATTGNQFRLTGTDWHFNLSTKAAPEFKNGGTWLLRATLEDGSQYTVWITIKK